MSAAYRVLSNKDLWKHIVSFQKGKKWDSIKRASWVCENGHLTLLNQKKDLIFEPTDCLKAARKGYLKIVQWLYFNKKFVFVRKPIEEACEGGHLDIVRWLYSISTMMPCLENAMFRAAKNNQFHVVRWLMTKGVHCSYRIVDLAAYYGRLDLIQWFYSMGIKGSFQAMDNAATNGYLDVVVWLHENQKEGCTTKAMDGACFNGHLDILDFLYKHRSEGMTLESLHVSIRKSNIAVLEWISKNLQYSFNEDSMRIAYACGNLKVIQWLHRKDVPIREFAIKEAIFYQYFHILQWTFENFVLNTNHYRLAIELDSVECIKYFVDIDDEQQYLNIPLNSINRTQKCFSYVQTLLRSSKRRKIQ